ncbi:MAG TPA: hypothetical protein VIV09_09945, partial [Pseudolabrys sp.]
DSSPATVIAIARSDSTECLLSAEAGHWRRRDCGSRSCTVPNAAATGDAPIENARLLGRERRG